MTCTCGSQFNTQTLSKGPVEQGHRYGPQHNMQDKLVALKKSKELTVKAHDVFGLHEVHLNPNAEH